jgi:hypothetical protein
LTLLVYADESGDLGWSFTQPYGRGGSSRFLTIAALHVPQGFEHLPERTVRGLYKRFHWDTRKEKKWVDMKKVARDAFAKAAVGLLQKNIGIRYTAIIVSKERVQPHIREDENKLYNYMIRLMLAEDMAKHPQVTFLPDPRSIKVESGNSLHDYLQTVLWFDLGAQTRLETTPQDSAHCLNIQFADMLAGTIQSHFELGDSGPWHELKGCIHLKKLFF